MYRTRVPMPRTKADLRIDLYLDGPLAQALTAAAQEGKITKTEIIRIALKQYLYPGTEPPQAYPGTEPPQAYPGTEEKVPEPPKPIAPEDTLSDEEASALWN